ncbi:molybdenum cofactor guanylyltransferase [Terrimonas pollutisoli]|uniref:molybdenum cofactor guanylyltransferase n=1 Tax=Terrimonas pollutisoli TaxID=3034147 RepID=UPI0023EB6A35|nr:molybdenum cofactor guanylyltransferase [Terrimonas sp. H1YJ31]
MTGIVLCGGQSSRMGQDKGLIPTAASTWTQSAVDKLAVLNIPVKISVNKDQFNQYAKLFPETDLVPDNTTLSLKGPLLGVLSSHLQFPNEDLFVLACDMPLMQTPLLQELYSLYQQDSIDTAFVFTTDGEPEPLCGIYKAGGLAFILSLLQSGQLLKYSMKFSLDHLQVKSIAVPDEQKKYFKNFNAHADLNGL